MKIAAIADVHLANHKKWGGELYSGINYRAKLILTAMQEALIAGSGVSFSADMTVICGDIFDHTKPTPQLMAEAMKTLSMRGTASKLIAMVGNHDQVSVMPDDHALGPFNHIVGGDVISQPTTLGNKDTALIFIPFVTTDLALDQYLYNWLDEYVQDAEGSLRKNRILFLHAGISDDATPFFLKGAHDSIRADRLFDLMEQFEIEVVVAGNWHNHQIWQSGTKRIVQCGALVPTGFDNPSNDPTSLSSYGRVICIDTKLAKGNWVASRLINGPRFVTTDWESLIADDTVLHYGEKLGHKMFLHVTAQLPHMAAAKSYCEELLQTYVIEGYELFPDKSTISEAAHKAARLMNYSTTIDEALVDYVKHIELPKEIKRKALVRKLKEYIK